MSYRCTVVVFYVHVGDTMLCSQKLLSVFCTSYRYLVSAESASCHIVPLDEQLELFW